MELADQPFGRRRGHKAHWRGQSTAAPRRGPRSHLAGPARTSGDPSPGDSHAKSAPAEQPARAANGRRVKPTQVYLHSLAAHGRRHGKVIAQLAVVPLLLLLLLLAAVLPLTARACQPVHFGPDLNGDQKVACRCDEHYCDSELSFEWPQDGASMFRLTSSLRGARFEKSTLQLDELLLREPQQQQQQQKQEWAQFSVRVDIGRRLQQVVGYGGAFTDSAAMLIRDKLTPGSRAHLLASYFGPAGLDYNLARVPIGGTDMSWRPYSYDDLPAGREDFELSNFRLQDEDLRYKLPLIREANALRLAAGGGGGGGGGGEHLKLLASSWSAPNWMKSNRNLVQGRLKDDAAAAAASSQVDPDDDLEDEVRPAATTAAPANISGKYYDAYARYICKFMDQYEQQLSTGSGAGAQNSSFKMWALTPQNEPCTPGRLGVSVVNYNSVNFEPEQMAQFIRAHLVPSLLRANRSASELALFIWDDTLLGFDRYKDHLFEADDGGGGGGGVTGTATGPSMQYVRGLALHWYSQGLDKLPYSVLYDLRRWLPQRYSIISTEASFIGRPIAGDWTRGEKYARDIIENLRSGSIGWIDWNLALNFQGGPTWSKNFLDAPVLVNELDGSFLKNPMFYAIGHLSRFVKARSYIVDSQVRASAGANVTTGLPGNNTGGGGGASGNSSATFDSNQWRLVDEAAEQTSGLLVVASELYFDGQQHGRAGYLARQIALVLLNRTPSNVSVSLELAQCRSQLGARRPLTLLLEAKSITSLAFNC